MTNPGDTPPSEAVEMEEQMDELLRNIRDTRDDAEHVFAVGAVVVFSPETEIPDDHGEPANGFVWRMVNPTVHEQYENTMAVLEEARTFDDQLDGMKILSEPEPEIQAIGVADLFGG